MPTRLRVPSLVALVALVSALAAPVAAGAAAPSRVHSPAAPASSDRLIVRYQSGAGARAEKAARRAGGVVVRSGGQDFMVVRVPKGRDRSVLARTLREDTSVADVGVDRVVRATMSSNDPSFPQQWGLTRIGANAAWDVNTGQVAGASATPVKVAVLDTGVDFTHPDLQGRIGSGYDVLAPSAKPQDDYGHGTAVSGVIAETLNNHLDGAGVAPGATIIPVKVLDSNGGGYDSDVITGIRWAADHGARIINMSLGAPGTPDSATDQAYRDAIAYATSKGSVLVAAAGNTGQTETAFFPASCPGVIAVGATNTNDQRAGYSSYGPYVDLAAPGDNIVSAQLGGGTGTESGTSLAAPFVTGVAALVAGRNPSWTPGQITQQLESTARDLGPSGRDDAYGYGLVQAAAALSMHGPDVRYAAFTNSVAYDLKSLQTTRFRFVSDQAGATAVLRIKTPRGDRVFTATTGAPGTWTWMPYWNGMGPDGKPLSSANYDWQLTVTRNGLSTYVKGKITVAHIIFQLKGTLPGTGTIHHTAYMIPGYVVCYVVASTTAPPGSAKLVISGPGGYRVTAGGISMTTTATTLATWRVQGTSAIRTRAVHALDVTGSPGVTYAITVWQ